MSILAARTKKMNKGYLMLQRNPLNLMNSPKASARGQNNTVAKKSGWNLSDFGGFGGFKNFDFCSNLAMHNFLPTGIIGTKTRAEKK